MTFPLHIIFALTVLGAFAAISVWGLFAVLRAQSLTEAQRMIAAGGIILVLALMIAWVLFVRPLY